LGGVLEHAQIRHHSILEKPETFMSQVKNGDKIKVHYTGRLKSGEVFDSSREREPLAFTLGLGQLIPGFENGVIGMVVGENRTVEIPPDEAYGPHLPRLVTVVKRSQFPRNITPEIGQELQTEDEGGRPLDLRVTKIEGDNVTLDANHHLAGETLIFDIEVVEIS
jgi:peptidylprolyl isomerase